MNYIWNIEGIKVGSITMNRWDGMQMWTSGFCIKEHPKYSQVLQWESCALQGGWYIIITSPVGKIGEYQGSTFNLPLEISSAVNKLV